MMTSRCDKARHAMYLYLDGELTWYRRVRVWWHVRRCDPCEGGFSFEETLKLRVRKDCAEDVPPELYERLRGLLEQEGSGSSE